MIESLPRDDTALPSELLQIYTAGIPACERKPPEALHAMRSSEDYRFIVEREGGAVVGFAALFAPPDADVALLEYLVVSPHRRGRGIGRALFRASVGFLGSSEGGRPMLVEVDASPGAGACAGSDVIRRQRFYRGLGCVRLEGLHYRLPLDRPSLHPPTMELFIHFPASPPAAVARPQVESWLRTIYARVYQRSTDDARIDEMLRPVPDPVLLA